MNEKLNAAIAAIGGPVSVAFHMKRTVTWVYQCKASGGIRRLEDAVRFHELATQHGAHLDVADLVVSNAASAA